MSSNQAIELFFGVISPIATAIMCSIMIWFMISLIKSFKSTWKTAKGRKLKVLAISVIVTGLLYSLSRIAGRLLIGVENCTVRMPVTQFFWCWTRASLYYFFIIRCQLAFEGSSFAFSKWTIRSLEIFISVWYTFLAIWYVATANENYFDHTRGICTLRGNHQQTIHIAYHVIIYHLIIIDFILGVITVGLYGYKLWTLQKLMGSVSDEDEARINYFRVAKKQGKLAWASYGTTLMFIYLCPMIFSPWTFPWIDQPVNVFCIYCTFGFKMNEMMYQKVCECNGNRCLLCFFCCCCCCCHLSKDEDAQKLSVEVGSGNSTTAGTNMNAVQSGSPISSDVSSGAEPTATKTDATTTDATATV